ncbi:MULTISPECIES: glycosyltransferase family 4 protein [Tetragenococcus]|uniref:glycosyltransferase family 4 protein n=1 Tax=Tetragenococcus TaxID=51668 RepID=UPI001F24878B|nr:MULTISPECIES: glycosyltransferase [Tetragenococcus]MCF1680003.1 glycosyltransferase [Tetragenococcus koreensis]MCF1687435.1 glycosyltransferase [Tetragenococcus koreensis]MCO8288801.1 glycosyltransferase [Tetragenococcus halophilus]MDN6839748.1 glycosyltransferase [Tetragenococcus halophilus]
MTLFIGPIADTGGPAIKNKLLLKYLDPNYDFQVFNTYKRKKIDFIKIILQFTFSKEQQIIISVSKNGRRILYPIILLKKLKTKELKYITICIGGTIVEDALQHRTINKALQKSDMVSVETKTIKDNVEKKLLLNNVFFMPNYKEMNQLVYKEANTKYNFNLRFVFLSSVRNVKGVETMLKSFSKLLKEYPDASLDIYGPVRKDFNIQLLKDIEGNKNITYKGVVNNNQVVRTLSDYDVFLFPTEYDGEGFPAVIVEAYLAGLVVISSDKNYNTEIVKNKKNGWIFPAGDEKELLTVLKKCFNNIDELQIISKNNLAEAQLYNAEEVIGAFRNDLIKLGWKL